LRPHELIQEQARFVELDDSLGSLNLLMNCLCIFFFRLTHFLLQDCLLSLQSVSFFLQLNDDLLRLSQLDTLIVALLGELAMLH